jgi:GDPmannose 4,6-dehydratase
MKKKSLITGATGQIGSYLTELLIEKDYEVIGFVPENIPQTELSRVKDLPNFRLERGDLGDFKSIEGIIKETLPDEIYNLAAQSNAQVSITEPDYTYKINAFALLRICETARLLNKSVKICQASSAQIYGSRESMSADENSPVNPENPYAVAKLFAHWTIKNYREAFDMFCSNGILFNSESPRRGENFVTRKITKGIADIVKGRAEQLHLGNLNAKRDWIHAKDSAKAMYLILQANEPGDYVIASGKARSIREFAEAAFRYADIELAWRGKGLEEQGYDAKTGKTRISIDPKYFRPAEVDILIGDASKARKELGWAPEITFDELVKEMVEHDLKSM